MKTVIISDGLLESVPLDLIESWEQLQTFSADLLKIKEDIIDAREYLRQGANQHGIDVYATVQQSDRLIVTQCKDTDISMEPTNYIMLTCWMWKSFWPG